MRIGDRPHTLHTPQVMQQSLMNYITNAISSTDRHKHLDQLQVAALRARMMHDAMCNPSHALAVDWGGARPVLLSSPYDICRDDKCTI